MLLYKKLLLMTFGTTLVCTYIQVAYPGFHLSDGVVQTIQQWAPGRTTGILLFWQG